MSIVKSVKFFSDEFHLFVVGGDQQDDIPTLSARIEEKQKRVDIRYEMAGRQSITSADDMFPQARTPK